MAGQGQLYRVTLLIATDEFHSYSSACTSNLDILSGKLVQNLEIQGD